MKKTAFTKKLLSVVLAFCIVAVIVPTTVFAADGPILEVRNASSVNENEFIFTNSTGDTIGRVKVSQNRTYKAASNQIQLNDYLDGEDFEQVLLELIPEEGYEVGSSALINGTQQILPGAEADGSKRWGIDVLRSLGNVIIIDGISFQAQGADPGPGPDGPPAPPPFVQYDVIAKFEGFNGDITSDTDSNILIPDNWTSGKVEFYARTCTVNGALQPYYDGMQCDADSYQELRLDIEGITNRDFINRSVGVEGQDGDEAAVFTADFLNYGRTGIHLVAPNTDVNQLVNVITSNLIFVKAEAQLGMSYSFGSATIDNAILTNTQSGTVSIFFGNTETAIIAEGPGVAGITHVEGGVSSVINENGTATVTLPPLSTETTTTLQLTIGLQSGSSVVKELSVRRTAIDLGFNTADGNATLEAGYVLNKAYLYNNQQHNDDVFDAYLQVILYKDGVVAGYKQVKIDDEEIVNSLYNNDSGSIELHGGSPIKLYGKDLNDTIEGVNSASVFLTNGPIDFNSETLPSVEFGIGSGITIQFGGAAND